MEGPLEHSASLSQMCTPIVYICHYSTYYVCYSHLLAFLGENNGYCQNLGSYFVILWNSHDILGGLIGPVTAFGRTNSDRYVMLDHFVYCVRKRSPALTTGAVTATLVIVPFCY